MKIRKSLLIMLMMIYSIESHADNSVIVNNNMQPTNNPSNTSNCNNNQSNNTSTDQKPGTYYQANPNGGMNTVYTTGDKKPYIVDNTCNNSPMIQPYVYATPPTPIPRPRR